MAGDFCVFKFLRRSVDRKHLMRFKSETSVFEFLRGSVNGALEAGDIRYLPVISV